MLRSILFCLTILFVTACNNTPQPTTVTEEGQFFGVTITPDNAIAIDDLMAKMETQDTVNVKFEGVVESVCKKKGCWATIKSKTSDKELFVKFKDYAFFLPLDCEGQTVIMDGYAYKEITPVDELQHYAEDEGASEEKIAAITEPKEELKFMASGVILRTDASKESGK